VSISVRVSTDPREVKRQAGALLAGDPVGHNVVGTRLADAVRYGEQGRYWMAGPDRAPAGLAVQQPAGTPLALAPMPAELVAAMGDALAAGDVQLPGVSGPADATARFAELWATRRQVPAALTSSEQLHEVTDLLTPAGVTGKRRRAAASDLPLLLSWLPGFEPGAGWARSDPAAIFVSRRLAAGDVWIWDDGGPVSMAARTEAVAGVARIQAVNTPPQQRGRGYAGAGVAALSASVLAQGLRCVLTVSVANGPANAVYRRLGYRVVSDLRRYRLG
jgi:predicted GNAT family acetyltransferase